MIQITSFYDKHFALYFIDIFDNYLNTQRSKRYFDLSYNKNIITFILSMIKMTDPLL